MRSERAGRWFQGWRWLAPLALLWGVGLACGSEPGAPEPPGEEAAPGTDDGANPGSGTPPKSGTRPPSEGEGAQVPWEARVGGPQDDSGTSVAVGRDGDVVVVVSQTPRQDADREPVAGERLGVVLGRYAADGTPRWTREFPRERLSDLRVATSPGPDGAVFLTGNAFLYPANFGLGPAQDGFLVRFAEDGEPTWQQRVGQKAQSVVADADGGVVVAGEEWVGALKDPVLTHYAADGSVRWTRRFTGTGEETALHAVALAPSGRVVLAGQLEDKLEVDGESFGAKGRRGFVVLEFDEAGKLVWGRELPGAKGRVTSVAVGPQGGVSVAGDFAGLLVWGGTSLGTQGPFVLAVGAEGEVRWLKQPECGEEAQEGVAAAVDETGAVSVACGDVLTRYPMDGSDQARRVLRARECPSGQCTLAVTGLAAMPGQGLVASGWLREGEGETWNQEALLWRIAPW
ncbi:hypothetical protein SAMN05443572_104355 [Myxococcus fulvus]|uniref:Lipoprotein n=1 Tax=Myxococcus fulvus TaxID=33 RepID=A0A511SYP5_MYXFU|nr:hypothetical protein [Myxococcus fulvus]GEN07021.1 hypothetical protein MFU01_20580 [Myxococcus fulvus]SEU01344.1 hypothetical protein SAMN05443572_104355 [Myxococcus fulvus]